MKFIQGHNRSQINLFPVSLEQSIDPDNEVRMIDLFVDSLTIKDYGFRTDFVENGRPAYHPSDLLKLFIYGYMNKVRFSRDLEKECRRNIEVIWLFVWYHKAIPSTREGFSYILTKKGKARAGADVGLMFIAYNLRRIGNILSGEVLKEYLRMLVLSIFGIFDLCGLYKMSFGRLFLEIYNLPDKNSKWLRRA